ncbi:MAG: N-acetylmuramoyl-L-alanine amidase [Lachnospiraceae bacterium]|nr:N-acetylmuramoyl-L-alanine amidase [Lachnospiraceae bacterium]
MGRTERFALRLLSLILVIFSVAGIVLLWTKQGTNLMARQRVDKKQGSLMSYLKQSDDNTSAIQKLHSLSLTIPAGHSNSDVTVKSTGMYTNYRIVIPDISASYFADFPVSGNGHYIKDLTYVMEGKDAVLTLTTGEPLFIERSVEQGYVFFDFKNPKNCFDRIVVIDAGHGGKDDGATAGGVKEKDLTLSIVKKIRDLTDKNAVKEVGGYGNAMTSMKVDGVGTVGFLYTRLSDKTVSLKERANLAKTFDADLFLSVHINSTASGRESSINGGQVLYRAGDKTGGSRKFAEQIMTCLRQQLGCRDRGTIAGDEIYIVRTAQMPVALAEIGFITNTSERQKLTDDDYQKKAASALLEAVMEEL